jgi:ORF6N domain-containing protein
VPTMRLNEQVRRNTKRFPEDFSFVLTQQEFAILKSQTAISSLGWGGRRTPPRAFTEHGAVMAASVLNTPIAVQASIEVVRAFVRLRQFIIGHAELARKVAELEAKYADHDKKIATVFEAIRQLMKPPEKSGRIGFAGPEKAAT